MEALVRGLIVDLITPLSADHGLDGPGLGRLLDRVLGLCQGVLLAGAILKFLDEPGLSPSSSP